MSSYVVASNPTKILSFDLFMAKPEKTFAGAHQGGELEVVRTKDDLEMIMLHMCLSFNADILI